MPQLVGLLIIGIGLVSGGIAVSLLGSQIRKEPSSFANIWIVREVWLAYYTGSLQLTPVLLLQLLLLLLRFQVGRGSMLSVSLVEQIVRGAGSWSNVKHALRRQEVGLTWIVSHEAYVDFREGLLAQAFGDQRVSHTFTIGNTDVQLIDPGGINEAELRAVFPWDLLLDDHLRVVL